MSQYVTPTFFDKALIFLPISPSKILKTIDEAAKNFTSPDAKLFSTNQGRLDEAQTLLNKFGLTGVPVLIVGEGQQARLIKTNALFSNINDVIAQL